MEYGDHRDIQYTVRFDGPDEACRWAVEIDGMLVAQEPVQMSTRQSASRSAHQAAQSVIDNRSIW
jgi:hypothetical protein